MLSSCRRPFGALAARPCAHSASIWGTSLRCKGNSSVECVVCFCCVGQVSLAEIEAALQQDAAVSSPGAYDSLRAASAAVNEYVASHAAVAQDLQTALSLLESLRRLLGRFLWNLDHAPAYATETNGPIGHVELADVSRSAHVARGRMLSQLAPSGPTNGIHAQVSLLAEQFVQEGKSKDMTRERVMQVRLICCSEAYSVLVIPMPGRNKADPSGYREVTNILRVFSRFSSPAGEIS